MTDIFGQDIKIDNSGNIEVTASGEVLLTEGVETGLQDIKIMLETPLGSLFYDSEFGSTVYKYISCENTPDMRLSFCADIKRYIETDSRVIYNSANCKVQSWNEKGVTLMASFAFSETKSVHNLIMTINSDMEMVIQDVNTG
jgi:phage baseplate assembly protein W